MVPVTEMGKTEGRTDSARSVKQKSFESCENFVWLRTRPWAAAALTRGVRARDSQVHAWRCPITTAKLTEATTRPFLNHKSEERAIRRERGPERGPGEAGSAEGPSVPGAAPAPASPRAPGLAYPPPGFPQPAEAGRWEDGEHVPARPAPFSDLSSPSGLRLALQPRLGLGRSAPRPGS